ncbi:hypothetical protein H257_16280 [Aphanomyces astaci]|uniref:Uncharacterized protein n=1 Tax=Aphanomyces astaci TaxID=112090 RepID=W4FL70_APHAT|nr:hypothetical protein H257_16280 [Aphanomyces astaci]ETV67549.1 hypothetical protein H257_16280 [Aphanomyces astaci]|eukprot:XP_009842953.1 hypothetical protein H257_16280 [Aphanomyces astaci]
MKARMFLADKHNLYAEHLKKPNATYTELAVWAMDAFKLISPPTKSTVGNTRGTTRRANEAISSHAEWTEPLKFSKGWLYKFQRKHGLTSKRQHVEAGSTPQEAVDQGREKMLEATTGYEDYPRPHHGTPTARTSLSPSSSAVKSVPDASTAQTAENLGFDYTSSKEAWMNGAIFDKYMRLFNARMEAANRRVLLLVDNASPHKVKEDTVLTNVSLKMLPPNTTAAVKQRQLQNALEQIDAVMAGRQEKLYEVPLVDAMAWAKDAWHDVSQSTIVNCLSRTGILHREAGLQNPRIVGHE